MLIGTLQKHTVKRLLLFSHLGGGEWESTMSGTIGSTYWLIASPLWG